MENKTNQLKDIDTMKEKINYPYVFDSIDVGEINLKNRIVFPAYHSNFSNADGSVSDKLIDFYNAIAKGGCALIFTGAIVVSSDSVAFDRVMRIDDDRYISGLSKLFSEIEKNGAVPAVQLIHYGRQALNAVTGHDLIAPSAIPCPLMSQFDPNYHVREMTLADIERVRNDFINATVRAADAGVKVVEIHAAHGYLLNEFLSPYSNYRKDDYGGSLENRIRLIVEILEGIRSKLGSKIAISVRVSGDEFVDGGLKPSDYKEIIPILEHAGMDMLDVSVGVYESAEKIIPAPDLGKEPFVDIAAELKQYATVPVCTVGSILSLSAAESIISSGKADLVAIGRAQVADYELVNKSLAGRENEIRQCTQCGKCISASTGDPEMYCIVNPSLKRPK
ncbi:MAG: NADH:flavin oxidoreductase [Methanosarcinaceae archaeon]|nr:NADH:flavin oxidoreductase [Methanosarcinaceae archaeon]